jgi:hypothetical protein
LYHGGTHSYIINDTGSLFIDSADNLLLDVAGGSISFQKNGTSFGEFVESSSDFIIQSKVQDKDLIFKGNDGGSTVTALTLDMSASRRCNIQ